MTIDNTIDIADVRIATMLRTLRNDLPVPPPGLVDDILRYVFDTESHARVRRFKMRYVAAASGIAAVAGGAVVVTAIALRHNEHVAAMLSALRQRSAVAG